MRVRLLASKRYSAKHNSELRKDTDHASSDSQTSHAVLLAPTSITRLQNASLALFIPPEHTMNSLCDLTSLLKPRMYAWYRPILSGTSGVQCLLPA